MQTNQQLMEQKEKSPERKLKILLVNPPIRTWAKPNCFPTGIGLLHAFLEKLGYEVGILDVNGREDLRGDLTKTMEYIYDLPTYDVYGVGGLITTFSWVEDFLFSLPHYLAHKFNIVIGGALATTVPHLARIMFYRNNDALIRGDGELALVNYLQDLSMGTTQKSYEQVLTEDELNTLPYPRYMAWETFETYVNNPIGWLNVAKWEGGDKFRRSLGSMNIISARGCPYDCHFCASHYLTCGNLPRYRVRSVEEVCGEIAWLYDFHDIRYIHFNDELAFTASRIREFCDELELWELDSRVYWGGAFRIDKLTIDVLQQMWKNQCRHIGTGLESGSPEMLRRMNKKFNLETAALNIETAKEIGFDTQFTLIVGYPGETMQTLKETEDFLVENSLAPETVFFATAYPGTHLYNYAFEKKLITKKTELDYVRMLGEQGEAPLLNFTKALTNEDLETWAKHLKEVAK